MLASCSHLVLIPAVVARWLPLPHGKALLQSPLSLPRRRRHLARDELRLLALGAF